MATPEDMYPVAELAKAWRCSKNKIYDLISRGDLKTVDIGEGKAKTRIPKSSVDEYLDRKGRRAGERPSRPRAVPAPREAA